MIFILTYDFENVNEPLYTYIYKCIKADILSGNLKPGEKLPSRRAFANNNGISTITIQNAYDQLVGEGYIYPLPKKGYYVSEIYGIITGNQNNQVAESRLAVPTSASISGETSAGSSKAPSEIIWGGSSKEAALYDLSSNEMNPENFPFSIWTKVSRDVMSHRKEDLMRVSPVGGVRELRESIADHLRSFRGMIVHPDQIIVGAGTEYLYGVITQLLDYQTVYVIENPGYKKLVKIYGQRHLTCRFASMDKDGVTVSELEKSSANVAHICPNHHFPTGITMPIKRRYEMLSWANEKEDRYIIEDDYDSEFRADGRPIPTLFSIDTSEKVIYINTFSKSMTPTIRISYMVLPIPLINRFYETMSFYSCTVSNFEQYTLAQFINQGYFEKHINRMRLYYTRQRKKTISLIRSSEIGPMCDIIENDSGLHFLLKIKTSLADVTLREKLQERGIKMQALSDYYLTEHTPEESAFIINYSNLKEETIEAVLEIIGQILRSN